MRLGRAKIAVSFLCCSLACAVPQLLARKNDKENSKGQEPVSSNQRRALHALNRLTFGPRPGDVQRVMTMGVDRWIDLQLHPEKIDDSDLNARLEPLRTVRMSPHEIAENFPNGQEIDQVRLGKRAMPSDPTLRAMYEVQIARIQDRKDHKEETGKNGASTGAKENSVSAAGERSTLAANGAAEGAVSAGTMSGADDENMMASAATPAKLTPEEEQQARHREEQRYADLEVQQLPSLSPEQRFKKVLSMSPAAQIAFADSLRGAAAPGLLEGLAPKQKEILLALNSPTGVVAIELAQAKLLRAIYSQRQLDEVMADFWLNHFNVFVDKGLDTMMLPSYERDVIRPHALGKFEDLLVATAKSPAMLIYLDNWLSVGPNSAQALGIPAHPSAAYRRYPRRGRITGKRPSGLNENYGRELLELHTLSVNGGYSQRDVTEVAKVFTGWTVEKPAEGGGFKFEPRMHEPGPKFVLGRHIKPKGEGEGLEVLAPLGHESADGALYFAEARGAFCL